MPRGTTSPVGSPGGGSAEIPVGMNSPVGMPCGTLDSSCSPRPLIARARSSSNRGRESEDRDRGVGFVSFQSEGG